MSCCGQNRAALMPQSPAIPSTPPTAPGRTRAVFEYVGRSSLRVSGPATGATYTFTRPGARLAVDLRDRGALSRVPNLREVP